MKSHRSIYDHNDLKGPLENMALPYYRTVGGVPLASVGVKNLKGGILQWEL